MGKVGPQHMSFFMFPRGGLTHMEPVTLVFFIVYILQWSRGNRLVGIAYVFAQIGIYSRVPICG